jgi:hypothetical protein
MNNVQWLRSETFVERSTLFIVHYTLFITICSFYPQHQPFQVPAFGVKEANRMVGGLAQVM